MVSGRRIRRAEIWLGAPVLRHAGLDDTIEGHLALRRRLGMNIAFFPVSPSEKFNPTMGYRYFNPGELERAVLQSGMPVGAVIDGPFQRLVEKTGLMALLSGWGKAGERFRMNYEREAKGVLELVDLSIATRADLIVFAEDIAWELSTYLHPRDMREIMLSFYPEAIARIRGGGALALYHSCGRLDAVIPDIAGLGFDGLAACEGDAETLLSVREKIGPRLLLFSGIKAALLQAPVFSERQIAGFREEMRRYGEQEGFVLCSSCGLYEGAFLGRIKQLYSLADRALGAAENPGDLRSMQ